MRVGALSDGFVLDASIALGWAFADERSAAGDAAEQLLLLGYARVPSFWTAEVANALVSGLRRGRIDAAEIGEFIADLASLDIRAEPTQELLGTLVEFAATSGLTGYDSAYVQLALDHGLPLATADKHMREVAESFGVALI
jgi:predicted nucleic acid-binding protein